MSVRDPFAIGISQTRNRTRTGRSDNWPDDGSGDSQLGQDCECRDYGPSVLKTPDRAVPLGMGTPGVLRGMREWRYLVLNYLFMLDPYSLPTLRAVLNRYSDDQILSEVREELSEANLCDLLLMLKDVRRAPRPACALPSGHISSLAHALTAALGITATALVAEGVSRTPCAVDQAPPRTDQQGNDVTPAPVPRVTAPAPSLAQRALAQMIEMGAGIAGAVTAERIGLWALRSARVAPHPAARVALGMLGLLAGGAAVSEVDDIGDEIAAMLLGPPQPAPQQQNRENSAIQVRPLR